VEFTIQPDPDDDAVRLAIIHGIGSNPPAGREKTGNNPETPQKTSQNPVSNSKQGQTAENFPSPASNDQNNKPFLSILVMVLGTIAVIDFNSTSAWRSEKGKIRIGPSLAPYHVFAAAVNHGKSDLPPDTVEILVAKPHGVNNKAITFLSVGAEFPDRHIGIEQWPDDMISHHASNMTYRFVIEPDDTQGYLMVIYEGSGYVHGFSIDWKYNTYRVVNSGQYSLDSVSAKFINSITLELPDEEMTSLDKIPSCGSLNKKFKKLPHKVDKTVKKEHMKNMVENIDPQQIIEDGITYTRVPLRFPKTISAPQQQFSE
jgi:hypothetical protein